MSEGILISILNMSFTGSVVALAVMGIRFLIRKLPGRYSYLLWAAVGFRLLCPFSVETIFSIFPVIPEPISQKVAYEAVPSIESGVFFLDEPVNYVLKQYAAPQEFASVNPLQIWIAIGTAVWAAGVILFVGINIFRYFRLKRDLRTAVLFPAGEPEEGNIPRRIYESDRISSPIAVGFVRPAIYLPFDMEPEERRYVILHENVHISRRDYLVKLTGFAALAVHWFNPVIWLSYFLMCQDMERSCDERVLDIAGEGMRVEYSRVLLRFAVKQSRLLLPLAFGESHTKIRIQSILRYRKLAPWSGAVITAAAVLAGCSLAANPQKESGSPSREEYGEEIREEKGSSEESDASVAVIGGADGPTSIFIAGKIGTEEEGLSCPPVNQDALANAGLDRMRTTVHLDYASKEEGQLIFHGPWGIFVYEKTDGKWKMAHSIDMKEINASYMAGGADNVRILPSGEGIMIAGRETEGWNGTAYYYDFSSGKLFEENELAETLNQIPEPDSVGPEQRLESRNNDEIEEKEMPFDYDCYVMEDGHLAVLASYTDRVLDLWFSDADPETQSMTQAYLFHGDGEETVYREEIRQFLFARDGYDYYVSLPTEPLSFEKNDSGAKKYYVPGRRELIRIDSQGHREILDRMMITGGSSEGMKNPVILAGNRLIYPGAEKEDLSSFKSESLISIALDGSDRQTAGRDRIPYGVFRSLCLDTENNQLYFEGWTNDREFPRPVYKTDTRLQKIAVIGEIEGNLITVRDGNFYFLHKNWGAVSLARLEEGKESYVHDKCGYHAEDYTCIKAYIADGQIYMTFVSDDGKKIVDYYTSLEEKEEASSRLQDGKKKG